jgi:hypothetical protein
VIDMSSDPYVRLREHARDIDAYDAKFKAEEDRLLAEVKQRIDELEFVQVAGTPGTCNGEPIFVSEGAMKLAREAESEKGRIYEAINGQLRQFHQDHAPSALRVPVVHHDYHEETPRRLADFIENRIERILTLKNARKHYHLLREMDLSGEISELWETIQCALRHMAKLSPAIRDLWPKIHDLNTAQTLAIELRKLLVPTPPGEVTWGVVSATLTLEKEWRFWELSQCETEWLDLPIKGTNEPHYLAALVLAQGVAMFAKDLFAIDKERVVLDMKNGPKKASLWRGNLPDRIRKLVKQEGGENGPSRLINPLIEERGS